MLLELIGGTFSVLQMLLLAYNYGEFCLDTMTVLIILQPLQMIGSPSLVIQQSLVWECSPSSLI